MKIAYLDCASGISGDMTLGALVDAGVELAAIQSGIDSLGLKDCRLVAEQTIRHGFRATNLSVEHPPEHAHRHLHHIHDMIDGSSLTSSQKKLARDIFSRLGEAEAAIGVVERRLCGVHLEIERAGAALGEQLCSIADKRLDHLRRQPL